MRRIIIFMVLAAFPYTSACAQGKYGNSDADSVNCIQNLSLYFEYYKLGEYNKALEYWEAVVRICPNSNKNHFANGRDILYNLLDNKRIQSRRKEFIKKLHWLYVKWIERDGSLQEILDLQEQDIEKYKK